MFCALLLLWTSSLLSVTYNCILPITDLDHAEPVSYTHLTLPTMAVV